MKDRFAVPIVPGAVITYPGQSGHRLHINDAVVDTVEEDGTLCVLRPAVQHKYGTDSEGNWTHERIPFMKRVKLARTDNVTVLPHVNKDDFIEIGLKNAR